MAEPERIFRAREEPIGAEIKDLLADVSDLVRSEIQLARVELTAVVADVAVGAIWVGAGLAVLFLAAIFLLLALTAALATLMPIGWAAFAVGLVVLVLGAIASWAGISRLGKVKNDLMLLATRETLREDAEWLKNRTR